MTQYSKLGIFKARGEKKESEIDSESKNKLSHLQPSIRKAVGNKMTTTRGAVLGRRN